MLVSIGEMLRQARQGKSLTLAQVAARTKINLRYLEAIEAGDRENLPPGGFFYKSFVRQYASVVAVDRRDLDAALAQILSEERPLPLPGQAYPVPKMEVPALLKVRTSVFEGSKWSALVSLALVAAAFAGIYWWWRDSGSLPPNTAVFAVRPASKSAPVPVRSESKPPAETPKPQPEALKPLSGAETQNPDRAELLVELQANEMTWISLTADGRHVFSGVLEARQSRSLEAHEFARLLVGNSGGLTVRWNGKPLGEIGPRGQVRIVNFSRNKFEIAAPVASNRSEVDASAQDYRTVALRLP